MRRRVRGSRKPAAISQAKPRKRPIGNRNAALHLTAEGERVMAGVRALRPAHEEEMSAGLTAAQRAQLADLLSIIADQQGLTPGVHPGYRG